MKVPHVEGTFAPGSESAMHRSGKSIIPFASVKVECKIVVFIEILLFTNVQHSVYSVAVGSTVLKLRSQKVFNDLLMAVHRGGDVCSVLP